MEITTIYHQSCEKLKCCTLIDLAHGHCACP